MRETVLIKPWNHFILIKFIAFVYRLNIKEFTFRTATNMKMHYYLFFVCVWIILSVETLHCESQSIDVGCCAQELCLRVQNPKTLNYSDVILRKGLKNGSHCWSFEWPNRLIYYYHLTLFPLSWCLSVSLQVFCSTVSGKALDICCNYFERLSAGALSATISSMDLPWRDNSVRLINAYYSFKISSLLTALHFSPFKSLFSILNLQIKNLWRIN